MNNKMSWALLLAYCGTVQAAGWVSIGKSAIHENFVDASSVKVAGATRQAWIKMVFLPHTQRGDGENAERWVTRDVARYAFDCEKELYRAEAIIEYYEDGSNFPISSYRFPQPWDPVPPDSTARAEMQFVCTWKAQ